MMPRPPNLLRNAARCAAGVAINLALAPLAFGSALPPTGISEAVASGRPQELIVEFDSRSVDQEASVMRQQRGVRHDDAAVLALRRDRYRRIKDSMRARLPAGERDLVADFDVLPMALVRVRTPGALNSLINDGNVVSLHRNGIQYPVPSLVPQLDSPSKSLIGQPVAAASGLTGAGTTVLVIDTGADYTVADLGSCTAAAAPSSCRVSHALYVNGSNVVVSDPNPPSSSSNNHGTNVAAIVAGVAVATHVAVINVFGTATSTTDAKIFAALNWAITNHANYNIRAINLSLGDGTLYTSPCSSGNSYTSAFSSLLAAGIIPVVAAGNNNFLNGLAKPACTPGAVSVGAVYVADYGSVGWSACTDSTTAANKVTCFSNSASFLTMLAPGAIITAGGQTFGGTSQASPFVAATIGLLYGAYPTATTSEQVARLTTTGLAVTDPRNSSVTPRLDLAAITTATAPAATGDVPTLPEWATILLGAILLSSAVARRKSARSPQSPA
jgi:subtilisin family serine protease